MIHYEHLIPENGYIIGEIACGHEGDINKFKRLIDCIAESGAQIIKFQIFTPLERATVDHSEWKIFNDLSLSKQEWHQAFDYARQYNLTIFADIFGEASFSIAKELGVDGYKIHSEDLLNTFFIATVAAEKKILMIGIGGAHRIEIVNLLDFLQEHDLLHNVLLMPGVQTFPTPLEAHSIGEIGDLIEKYSVAYGVKVGFADHVSGDLEEALIVPLMALAKGASIIEKHVTVDRKEQWEDYQSALGKKGFKRFIGYVKQFSPLLGKIGKFNSFEIEYRKIFKKTPIVSRDLEIGHILQSQDIEYVKHDDIKIPLSSTQLVDETLKTSVTKTTPFRLSYIKSKVGGVIVARCTSSRLPNKAILKIQGRETIALLIERIKRCQNLEYVILATSTDSSDDILVDIAEREGVFTFRGSLENLSQRFYEASQHYNLDYIARITGDDILRDEVMIDEIIESHLHHSCDVTFTANMPYGTTSDVFSVNAINTILKNANVPSNTEYLEWYLENDRYFSVNYVESPYQFNSDLRMTLDYEEDLLFFSRIFEHFYLDNPEFTLAEVLTWLEDHPTVMAINKHKTSKYTNQDIDVGLNI
jgi:spore coat polysaccharide biosynthesis protein SpsF (cytidylyltransferase family)/sialic acid synthase SpsE